jgi:acetyl esterase/lipase
MLINRCRRLVRSLVHAGTILTALVLLGAGTPLLADEARPAAPATNEVQVIRDIVYRDLAPGEDAAKGKNKLDLYLPREAKSFPVVFFVHGGAWRNGDKNGILGVYSNLGRFLARQGLGAVVINYRLSPGVQHPTHIQDVAKAFAWTHKHIAEYGGRPEQLFLCGHSAGGHLVALLATDPSYLKAEGLTPAAIKGIIPISGVYDVSFAGLNLFTSVFGKDPEVRKKASPVYQVRPDVPPALIIYADKDFQSCDRMSRAFCEALHEKKCTAQTLEVKERNHLSILLNITKPSDPVARALLGFVAAHTGPKQAAVGGGQ